MDLQIIPRKLSGSITPPPSKSIAHRLIIAAALGGGISTIQNVAFSQDIEATLRCMTAMGTGVGKPEAHTLRIHGLGPWIPQDCCPDQLPHFDCGESGSTLRFLIPIALAVTGGGVFTGHGRLMERPQKPYFDLFDEKDISYRQADGILTVQGRLTAGGIPPARQCFQPVFYRLVVCPVPTGCPQHHHQHHHAGIRRLYQHDHRRYGESRRSCKRFGGWPHIPCNALRLPAF